jgi:hypothetical protein
MVRLCRRSFLCEEVFHGHKDVLPPGTPDLDKIRTRIEGLGRAIYVKRYKAARRLAGEVAVFCPL